MVWWNWKNESTLGKMCWWSDGAAMVWWSWKIELKWYKSVFLSLNWRKTPSDHGVMELKKRVNSWYNVLMVWWGCHGLMKHRNRVEMMKISVYRLKLKKKLIRPWSDGTEKKIRLLVKCVDGLMGLPWTDEAEKQSWNDESHCFQP